MAKQSKNPLSINFDDEFIDAVADRVIEKAGLKKEPEAPTKELEFYNIKQIASITQKSNLTIRNHIHAGLLIANKVGKSFIVSKENLKNYLTNQSK